MIQEKEGQLFKIKDATVGLSPKEMEDNPFRLRYSESQGTEAVFQHCLLYYFVPRNSVSSSTDEEKEKASFII